MADTITNDEALAMIAKGHAALSANLAKVEPKPVEPPPVVVPPRPPEPVKEVTVALGGLAKAIAAAEPGVRIVVTAASAASFSLKDVTGPAAGVTLDLSKVKIGNLQVANVANVEFLGLDLNIAQVRNSKAIRFTRANVHDSPTSGLGFYSCQGVVVTASTFSNLKNGIVHDHCDDVLVEGNLFTGMTSDGVTGVGGVRVQIRGNDFRDFNPSPGAHPDAVQFFARNATRASTDIVIDGNRIHRGKGGIPQGIFITTQAGFEQFRYQRVRVTNNEIVGAMYNGISIGGADDVTVTGNTVQPFKDMDSRIQLTGVTKATVTGNKAKVLQGAGNSGLTISGNTTPPAIAA